MRSHLERPDLVLPKPKFLQQHQLVQILDILSYTLSRESITNELLPHTYLVPAQFETRQRLLTPVQLSFLHLANLILHQVQHRDLGQRWQVWGMSDSVERQI